MAWDAQLNQCVYARNQPAHLLRFYGNPPPPTHITLPGLLSKSFPQLTFTRPQTPVPSPSKTSHILPKRYNVLVSEPIGPSLNQLLLFCGNNFSLNTTAKLARQCVQLLEQLHDQNLCHCNVAPSHILIDHGQLYLINFAHATVINTKVLLSPCVVVVVVVVVSGSGGGGGTRPPYTRQGDEPQQDTQQDTREP